MRKQYKKYMKELKKQTKVQTKKKTVFKEAFSATLKAKKGFSMSLFWFAFLSILSLCLAYVRSFTLFVTIPFVIIPSYFAFVAMNSMDKMPTGETIGFFLMFKTYYSRFFFGCFKVISGFLKSLLTVIVSYGVINAVMELTYFSKDSEFSALMDKVLDGSNLSEAAEQIELFTSSNPTFAKLSFVAMVVSLMLGVIVFLHHLAKNSPKLDFDFYRKQPIPMREFGFVDHEVRHKHKKEFGGELFKCTWFMYLIIIISFATSSVIELFVFRTINPDHAFVLGLGICLILSLPFMNYISNVYHAIYFRLAGVYEETFVKATLELLNKYKEKIGMDAEEVKKIEEMLNLEKKKVDKKSKDDNDKKKKN